MGNLDLSTLNAGDILLFTHSLKNTSYRFYLDDIPNLLIVHSVNRDSSTAIVAPLVGTSGSMRHQPVYLLGQRDGAVTVEHFYNAQERFEPEQVNRFSPAEVQAQRLVGRLSAERELFKFLDAFRNKEIVPPVLKALNEKYASFYPSGAPSTHVGDLEWAREVMGAILFTAKNEYARLQTETNRALDNMTSRIYQAICAVQPLIGKSGIVSHSPTEASTVVRKYEYREDAHTFRVGSTFSVQNVHYTVTRVSKSRAYVQKTDTGEDAGYVTYTKQHGFRLHTPDGGVVSFQYCHPIAVADAAGLQAFNDAQEAVRGICDEYLGGLQELLESVYDDIEFGFAFHYLRRSGGAPMNVIAFTSFLYKLLSDIETARIVLANNAEKSVSTLERLIEQAYGA